MFKPRLELGREAERGEMDEKGSSDAKQQNAIFL